MNIGILAYRQFPYISANTAIAYIVGEALKKRGHSVTFIGRRQDGAQHEGDSYHGIPICYLNSALPKPGGRFRNKLSQVLGDRLRVRGDSVSLEKIVKEQRLDVLICVIAPIDDALIVYYSNLTIPVLLYQLDPFYNSMDRIDPVQKQRFLKILNRVSHLFTTNLLCEDYSGDTDFSGHMGKISVLEFPKLISFPAIPSQPKHTDPLKLLYAGSLYHDIRSPEILISLKRCLPSFCRLVFCGGCDRPEDERALQNAGIECRGYCSQEALRQEVADADFLINIGNLVKNQLGSKLIDYIATGKPILNITQLDLCPTLPVLDPYPSKLSVTRRALESGVAKDDILPFLSACRGCVVPWEALLSSYAEYTPEFVAGEILKICTQVHRSTGSVHSHQGSSNSAI